ncbi:MAG: GIY-YIG nuclease family protein [Alphaproteobacteria bacterium]|nr:GIY-YIG nuclease family protein [Alphaproteobacteria bacterium]
MPKQGYVYILASGRNGTLYIGVTSDLNSRIAQHKKKDVKGFAGRYGVDKLVYCETYDTIEEAIAREKAMKKWYRAWKLEAIERDNPEWRDLSAEYAV